jgi:hypothetical protein
MNDEQINALLRELAERLKSLEQRLADMQAAEQEMSKTYSKSHELYRQELTEYKKRNRGDTFRTIARVLMLFFLAYIAYRVS